MGNFRFAVPLILVVLAVTWFTSTPSTSFALLTALTAEKLPVWADILKTMGATFLGAALAFASNQIVTSARERKEKLDAARIATFTLVRMMNNRRNIQDSIERFQREVIFRPGSPPIHAIPL